MKYTKPEINALGKASKMIQDFTKGPMAGADAIDPTDWHRLNPAYDLDE